MQLWMGTIPAWRDNAASKPQSASSEFHSCGETAFKISETELALCKAEIVSFGPVSNLWRAAQLLTVCDDVSVEEILR